MSKGTARLARGEGAARRGLSMLALAASLLVAACGGGGGGGAPEAPAEEAGTGPDLTSRDYMPAQVGDRWRYEDSSAAGVFVTRAIGTRATARGTGIALKDDTPDSTEAVQVRDAQGTWLFPGVDADAFDLALGPVRTLASPLRVGQRFVSLDRNLGTVFDFDGDGLADVATVRAGTSVVALETIDTAVGRLADCLHLRVTLTYTVVGSYTRSTTVITFETDEWYAPGLGLVRLDSVARSPGFADELYTQRLVGYRVGDRRTDTVAPTATAPGLAGGAVLGASTVVDILFSEDMDTTELANALAVRDAGGTAVAGTATVTGPRSLRFVPASGWSSGAYTATLGTTALDVLGNPLAAPQQWTFTIDATAPQLVDSTPLTGTIDVPLTSAIELRFSEPVDPASVNATTIQALAMGSIITSLTFEVDGATVRLRPSTQFTRGAPYTINIAGVTDLLGNRLSSATVSFVADPGRFGASVPVGPTLPGDYVGRLMAGGDLNGDGRADVVATSHRWTGTEWSYEVLRYFQQADGTLGPATPLVMPANCSIRSMQVADLDGDGRLDLVLSGADPCGLMLWRQDGTGQLVLDRVLEVQSGLIAVQDVNGDGRPDIGFATSQQLRVWVNQVPGWSLLDAVALPARPNQLAVGDLNGDGRPDFATSSIEQGATVTLMRQTGAGRFDTATTLSSGFNGGSFAVAIGDVTGDGRADLLVGESLRVGVFEQGADGTLAAFRPVSGSGSMFPLRLADINGDGRLDVLGTESQADLIVLLQRAGGTLAEAARYPGPFRGSNLDPDLLAVADVDGDGRPDVLLNGHVFRQRPVPVMGQSVSPGLRARAALSKGVRR